MVEDDCFDPVIDPDTITGVPAVKPMLQAQLEQARSRYVALYDHLQMDDDQFTTTTAV
jgi:hypothetical protein